MQYILSATKWIGAAAALLILAAIVAVHFRINDPNDAPLWAGITMGWLGLLAGGLLKKRSK